MVDHLEQEEREYERLVEEYLLSGHPQDSAEFYAKQEVWG